MLYNQIIVALVGANVTKLIKKKFLKIHQKVKAVRQIIRNIVCVIVCHSRLGWRRVAVCHGAPQG